MVQRVRLPVQGGNVKIVSSPAALSGTTIAGFEGQSLTISQLAVQIAGALGLSTQAAKSPGSNGSAAAAIVLGPGLTGGGPVVGAVPINLNASIPWNMQDEAEPEWMPVPGQPGARGAQGSNGPGVYLMDDPPEADWLPVPGQPGATGATGPQGPAGSGTAAAAGMWIPEDAPEADWMPVPGAQGARGLPGIAAAVGCWIPEDATDDPLIVGYGPQIQLTIPVGANPSASIGLTAVNGSAATFMRSDGAPALSQAIAPSWTGAHKFIANVSSSLATSLLGIMPGNDGVDATLWWLQSLGATDAHYWAMYVDSASGMHISAINDADSASADVLYAARTGLSITGITLGNTTTYPSINLVASSVFVSTSTGGFILRDLFGTSGYGAVYARAVTPSATNWSIAMVNSGTDTYIGATSAVHLFKSNAELISFDSSPTTGAATASFASTNKPGSNQTSPTVWLPVTYGASRYYIPLYA